jgi:hypothetical protein
MIKPLRTLSILTVSLTTALVAHAVCTAEPVAVGWEGCKPGTACPNPPTITGLRAASGGHGLDVYYNGAWRLAVDFGTGIDCTLSGSWGGPGSPAITSLGVVGCDCDGDGSPDDGRLNINGQAAITAINCWWIGNGTLGAGAPGTTRVVGAPTDAAHQGRVEFRGLNSSGVYSTMAVTLRNRCSG